MLLKRHHPSFPGKGAMFGRKRKLSPQASYNSDILQGTNLSIAMQYGYCCLYIEIIVSVEDEKVAGF